MVAVAEALPKTMLLTHDDYADKFDPHVWMNPNLWSRVVVAVRDALVDGPARGQGHVRANAAAHLEGPQGACRLHAPGALARFPPGSRVLLTAHDAFNYFGAAYGFEVLGIQGISTESEAGLNRIGELVDMLDCRARSVPSSSRARCSDRNIRALIEGAAAKGHRVTSAANSSPTPWASRAPTRAPISA